jgi:two-component system phosphate regulon sensor histidine kinase PhoR
VGRPQPLFRQIFLPLLLIVALSGAVFAWYSERSLQRTIDRESVEDLTAAANLAAFRLAPELPGRPEVFQQTCREMGLESVRRVTVVLPTGTVACDSAIADPSSVRDLAAHPEIQEALAGREAHAIARSRTLNRSFLYVAVPLRSGGAVVAALRLGLPYPEQRRQAIHAQLLRAMAAIVLLGAGGIYLVARRIAAPIERLTQAVDRFGHGDLRARLEPPSVAEVATLASALNAMADSLDARIAAIEAQRLLQETILGSMGEGVIATDRSGRMLLVNRSAAAMIGMEPAAALGVSLATAPRLAELGSFAGRTLATGEVLEELLAVGPEGGVRLFTRGAPLYDSAGGRLGSVIILSDVSRLQRLERTRQDFVVNVSHELRTPITIIKGYLELLLEGALGEPATAGVFLEKVVRQTERMRTIVDDLLLLSRLDQQVGGAALPLEPAGLKDVLAAAAAATAAHAARDGVRVELQCPEELLVAADPLLLTRAVANLLHNAIASTDPGGRVLVRGELAGAAVTIAVQDWGVGIAREHLPRIFERFYRVDRGRSRERGGSGLGLAIVKHIALVHGGAVSAESEPGHGSTFTITLVAGRPAPGVLQ